MRRFTYRAKDQKTGKSVKGVIQAENERTAGRLLLEQGYMPDKIAEEDAGGVLGKLANKVTTKDRITFTRQFATLIGAGLPLSNSLRTVAEQTQSKPMKKIVEEVLADVEAGRSLADSFGKHPDVFGKVYLALIAAGEMSGNLDVSLERLSRQEEKDADMMSAIKGAMTYPLIVLVVILAVIVFMLIVVIPQVDDLYQSMGEELPGITQAMVNTANFLMNQWYILFGVIGLLVWATVTFLKTKTGIRMMANIKLNVPIFKSLFHRLYMSRFARTAQMLLSTGVAMLDTIRISAEAENNVIMEEEFALVSDKVKAGKPLSESVKDRKYMLPLLGQMASIGEESGKIDDMLGKVADTYEKELDEKIAAISTMIEPILMVVMALLVGGMMAATLLPIYSLVNNI